MILYGTKYSPRTLSPPIYPVAQQTKPNSRKNSKKNLKKGKLKKQSTTPISTSIKQNISSNKPNVHIVLFPFKNSSKLSPTLTDNIQRYPSSHRLYSLQNVDGRPAKKNLSPERNVSPTNTGKNVCMEVIVFFACPVIVILKKIGIVYYFAYCNKINLFLFIAQIRYLVVVYHY